MQLSAVTWEISNDPPSARLKEMAPPDPPAGFVQDEKEEFVMERERGVDSGARRNSGVEEVEGLVPP